MRKLWLVIISLKILKNEIIEKIFMENKIVIVGVILFKEMFNKTNSIIHDGKSKTKIKSQFLVILCVSIV